MEDQKILEAFNKVRDIPEFYYALLDKSQARAERVYYSPCRSRKDDSC